MADGEEPRRAGRDGIVARRRMDERLPLPEQVLPARERILRTCARDELADAGHARSLELLPRDPARLREGFLAEARELAWVRVREQDIETRGRGLADELLESGGGEVR